jgi:hypothetical protein
MALALRRGLRRPDARGGWGGARPASGPARPTRTGTMAARGAAGLAALLLAIARLVRLAVAIIVLIIAAAIVLRVLSANASNSVVHDIHVAGRVLAGPFKDMFSLKNPKAAMALNWGIAAIVYVILGSLIASLIARAAPRRRGLAPVTPAETVQTPADTAA